VVNSLLPVQVGYIIALTFIFGAYLDPLLGGFTFSRFRRSL